MGVNYLSRAPSSSSPGKENTHHTYLDFIIGHFEGPIWPRTISTKATENHQILVYSKEEALRWYKAANFLDCKINAYPSYTEWNDINRQAPDFIFIDKDQNQFKSRLDLDNALNQTLNNIKNRLGGSPSIIWSGHGYHIYQPVNAFIMEEECEFTKFEQPSRRFIQFAEIKLSGKQSDPCHSHTMSFKNCMLRVPGSYNAKSDPPVRVEIIQQWNGVSRMWSEASR